MADIKKKETMAPKKNKEEVKVEKVEPQSQSTTKSKKKHRGETPFSGRATSSRTPRKLYFDISDGDADDEAVMFSTPKPTPSSTTKSLNSAQRKVLGTPWVTNKYYTVQSDLKTNDMVLGKYKVEVRANRIHIGDKFFSSTPGLLNLLLMSDPIVYTANDLKVYKQILDYTNVHRYPNGEIVRDQTNTKYLNIIAKLFPEKKKGGALNTLQTDYMIHDRNEKKHLTYWDDPNELVERLKLLVASQSAGHTGHNNEIMSIIEELREAKIIK